MTLGADPLELGEERPRAVAQAPGKLHPLEEAVLVQPAVELLLGDEPVVAAVYLARSRVLARLKGLIQSAQEP